MHTPGEWQATHFPYDNGTWDITAWDDETIHIATVGISASNDPDEENKANARLIAAAPDLLKALKRILDSPYDPIGVMADAEQAITKAKGE